MSDKEKHNRSPPFFCLIHVSVIVTVTLELDFNKGVHSCFPEPGFMLLLFDFFSVWFNYK